MDAPVTVCSGNTNVNMVWAWMLWSPYVLGLRKLFWFGHGTVYKPLAATTTTTAAAAATTTTTTTTTR